MISNLRLRSTIAVLLGLSAILVIAASDFLAAGVGLAPLYLVPVIFVAWFVDRRAGCMVSLVALIAELATDVLGGYATPVTPAPYVDALFRCALFLFVTLIVTAIKVALEREKALARTDALTGVMNARMFRELGSLEIQKAQRYERSLSVAFIDIDDFKSVNDQFGHGAGDALLQTVARTVKEHIRATDIVARLGGDEFAIILPETGAVVAPLVVNKLLNELMAALKHSTWPVTFSIGLMTFAEPPPSVSEMLRLTDLVMYEVKQSGKDKIKQVVWTGESAIPVPVAEAVIAETPVLILPAAVELVGRRRPLQAVVANDTATAPPSGQRAWLATFVVLALTLVLTAALAALVESLPGSSLYPLKRQSEHLQLGFVNDLQTAVRVHIALADRRLGETAALLNAERYELAEATALEYGNEIDATLSAINSQPMLVSLDLLQVVAERLAAQQDRLVQLDAKSAPQVRAIVERSLTKSRDTSGRLALIAGRVVVARLNLTTATISTDAARVIPTSTSGATATLAAAPDPSLPSTAPTLTPTPTALPTAPIQSTPLPDAQTAADGPTVSPTDVNTPTPTPTRIAPEIEPPTATPPSNVTAAPTPAPTTTIAPPPTTVPTSEPKPKPEPPSKPTPEKHPKGK
jgi:diguanylate cyclase (GGDEF)-like protein